ncbi:haloacid dehalogenase superfamily, subfamily IA, variant 3 with third motif having DD or ED/haloacid dehalogenase superfamily, subfamily IA, variant 1 with third motif having Dx(3-4)D or Dx(3-4)E [Streptococcus equinus]|uniref:Haloacid dehalogenase superfamily, subfamily IA, variant 3 with third motif having DD or ED/haloacid dehalogenase superfamily, subfamily IA, variant 1 with third motif having Dx(3-4)D or Dx(3-4)E n=1 Tax=Streptococcus equinus TaxID=1335 RepID=A0A1H0PSI0_STREI|nr:HAD family phosphatase [Streptococcus equinus]SDP08097.1 haloacid dehalogenase superfamily, subfamily IA, variant 3 with third motif having DD or ED/haloacid dehalogenase superfamily, subfamily IA, variant 1 with third motif having Dx(3-4)D or Dx(3-4)E [Streptococcus equinus]
MEKFKAIIFDMDGVLFDTETFYYRRREKFLAEKGISIKHLPPSFFIGGNMKQIWPDILRDDFDKWDTEQLQKEYSIYKKTHPLPYKNLIFEDTFEVVKGLFDKGFRLGLASSSTKHDILKALDETQLREYFSVILSGEEFEKGKPHPAIYQEARRQLGFNNEETLVIEDSEKGIQAGVSADLAVWAIEDTLFDMDQSKASRLVKNLTQVIEDLSK